MFELSLQRVNNRRITNLAPIVRIKEVVGAALVGRGFLYHGHTGRLRDPHLLLHVIPPFAVISAKDTTQ